MGCQDLLEFVPGRGRVTSASTTPGGFSEGKSLKVRAGLSGRSANGKTTKTDDLSCESRFQLTLLSGYFLPLNYVLQICSIYLSACQPVNGLCESM